MLLSCRRIFRHCLLRDRLWHIQWVRFGSEFPGRLAIRQWLRRLELPCGRLQHCFRVLWPLHGFRDSCSEKSVCRSGMRIKNHGCQSRRMKRLEPPQRHSEATYITPNPNWNLCSNTSVVPGRLPSSSLFVRTIVLARSATVLVLEPNVDERTDFRS